MPVGKVDISSCSMVTKVNIWSYACDALYAGSS